MVLDSIKKQYAKRDNEFYRKNYSYFLYGLIVLMAFMFLAVGILLYQVLHRPVPAFYAIQADGQKMQLTPFTEPNLLPDTIVRFACQAAVTAYTFDFLNYEAEIGEAKPFFTEGGWQAFRASMADVINKVVKAQLFVNGVVVGTPVISNQGEIPGKGYVWRVQIPFLGSYSSSERTTNRNFYVVVSIVRVPTSINPQGIGIDQFLMTG